MPLICREMSRDVASIAKCRAICEGRKSQTSCRPRPELRTYPVGRYGYCATRLGRWWRVPPPGARSALYCVRRAKRVKPSACLGKGRFCSRRRRSGSIRLSSSPGAAPGSNSGHFVSRPAPPLPSSSSTDGAVRRKKRWPRRGKRFSRRTASWGQPYQQQ